MDAHTIFATPRTAVLALSLVLALGGCKSKPATDDATLNSQVQTALSSDQNLDGQTIQASVADGVVTLNGSVTTDTARTIVTQDVSQIAGVKKVVDNLVLQTSHAPASAMTRTPAPIRSATGNDNATAKAKKPSTVIAQAAQPPPAPIVRNTPPPPPTPQPAPPAAIAQAPPPPPAPVAHSITLSPGFVIPVRITQTLDSATSQTGDKFTGAIASDIVVDGLVVLPQGTPVTGHVDAVQDAAHFKGSSLLTISLSAISRKGEHINVATDPYTRQGEGRGKNTAEKVGGGAAVGAILGSILGGGRGAAIGTAAGAGVGAGAQGVTRGQQVQIASETVVRFSLSDAVVVRVPRNPSGNSGGALEHHTDQ
jgi:BON domain